MRTLLKSQDLWDLVEYGFVGILDPIEEEEERLKTTKQRDAKALFILQQVVHETIFSQILVASTSKEAWLILQKEFQSDLKVIVMKLQSLRCDFETLLTKNDESMAEFLVRTMAIVGWM
ncbi:hypothetical protein QN277_002405 [Acacia crassicarpa]|uniref:UBN2 domain-containing protein n=1 Tax=Acacia crassicarpa TaxID=499986 RepID=A0AAE1TJL1_9FABA|nr:hypothetical protein QN277_002405 [Acacia crassicarpa]